jgi:sulfite reductase alpha subunit-like flavoprotein
VTAFSRDTAEKVYVWHRMLEEGARVAELLLQQGGAIYVCGDGFGMAQDVDKALAQILREHGGQTADEATATLAGWKGNGRYRRDIWS